MADMNFWRGPAYTAFFEYLDSKGGFYYEVRFTLSLGLESLHYVGSVGEMPQFIVSPLRCLPPVTRSNSLMK